MYDNIVVLSRVTTVYWFSSLDLVVHSLVVHSQSKVSQIAQTCLSSAAIEVFRIRTIS